MKQTLLFLFIFINAFVANAQNGCTDPNALNYSTTAKTNDGSCTYASTVLNPEKVCTIDDKINETSGLIFWRGRPWTHNDSGGDPYIYAIDTITGAITQTVKLIGAHNEDWEDISQDKDYIYIGEMGNNNGTRKNLKVLRLAKANIPLSGDVSLSYDSIKFRYAEQTDFTSSQNHNFDCEGFIFYNDSLHIFTKNRGNTLTYHYTLSAIPSATEYVISRKDSFMVNGMVTGADINPQADKIILTGYVNLASPHFWIFFDFKPGQVFSGNKRRIELPGPQTVGQLEAVCFKDEHQIFLSNEALPGGMPKQTLYRVNTYSYTESNLSTTVLSHTAENLEIIPNPAENSIVINTPLNHGSVTIYNNIGKLMYQGVCQANEPVNISEWPKGVYYIKVLIQNQLLTQKFVKI